LDYLTTHTSLLLNTARVHAWLCKLQKGCTRLAAASDKVKQLLTHGQWFSLGTPASSTTKTGCHDIAEILLKVALNTINQIKSNLTNLPVSFIFSEAINFFFRKMPLSYIFCVIYVYYNMNISGMGWSSKNLFFKEK
jgi:hypothetical protein